MGHVQEIDTLSQASGDRGVKVHDRPRFAQARAVCDPDLFAEGAEPLPEGADDQGVLVKILGAAEEPIRLGERRGAGQAWVRTWAPRTSARSSGVAPT